MQLGSGRKNSKAAACGFRSSSDANNYPSFALAFARVPGGGLGRLLPNRTIRVAVFRMQPQQGGGLYSPESASRRKSASSEKARATSTSASASSSSASSRASTVSSRARSQPDPASLLGLFRSGVDLNARSSPSTSANSTTASATGGSHRRWTTDADGSSPSAKARSKGQGSLGKMRHTADHASPKGGGLGSRRSISMEARAAPLTQAQLAPHYRSSAINSSANGSSDGAAAGDEETELPVTPSAGGPADMMQSADDDLDPDTIRAKSHEQASTRGNPEMVLKWDSQLAMKPIAFDQDDHVRSEDSFLDIAVVSRGGRLNSGWKKENQDKFLLQLNRDDGWSVMGVFDGHGMWGGKVASIVRDAMLKALKDVDGRKMNGSDPEMVLRNAFDFTEAELESSPLDLTRSGTTAVLSIVTSDWIATAWAGDSRMVLGRQASNEDGQSFLEAVELTEDHKPDNPGECRRINEAGGRVDRLVSERTKEPIGPFRVYLQYSWSPGLACSRAFGDKMAVEVGVTHKPDVTMHSLQPEDQYLIVASDGVWELVSSQEAVEIVALYPDDVEQGVAHLLQVSRERWAAIQGGRTCDDITAVVTKLNMNAKSEAASRENTVAHAAHS